jgi:hypothetical protein
LPYNEKAWRKHLRNVRRCHATTLLVPGVSRIRRALVVGFKSVDSEILSVDYR